MDKKKSQKTLFQKGRGDGYGSSLALKGAESCRRKKKERATSLRNHGRAKSAWRSKREEIGATNELHPLATKDGV